MPARRVRDLVIALLIHVLALPLWFIQAFLWDFPGQTKQQMAKTEVFIMIYGGALTVAYIALLVALIVWWRQGRQRAHRPDRTKDGADDPRRATQGP